MGSALWELMIYSETHSRFGNVLEQTLRVNMKSDAITRVTPYDKILHEPSLLRVGRG